MLSPHFSSTTPAWKHLRFASLALLTIAATFATMIPGRSEAPSDSLEAVVTEGVAPGRWLLEVVAEIPGELRTGGARFEVLVNDVVVKPGDGNPKGAHGEGGGQSYDPYWLIEADGAAETYRLRYLTPLMIAEPDSTIIVQPIERGVVRSVQLDPWLDAPTYTGDAGGVSGIYFPSQEPTFTLSKGEDAGTAADVTGRVVVQELRLADGDPPAWSRVDDRVTQGSVVRDEPLDLAAKRVEVAIPTDRFGTYGIVVELTAAGDDATARSVHYLGSIAVIPERDMHAFNYDGKFMISTGRGQERNGFRLAEAAKMMGFDWYRTEYPWERFEPKAKGEFDWSETDALHDQCRKYGLYAMNLAAHAPPWLSRSATTVSS